MNVYIDSNFHCHTTNPDGSFREVSHPFFIGKCTTLIEGYCCEPDNEKIYPWKPYSELDAAQREYERSKLVQYEQELPQAYLDGVNSI